MADEHDEQVEVPAPPPVRERAASEPPVTPPLLILSIFFGLINFTGFSALQHSQSAFWIALYMGVLLAELAMTSIIAVFGADRWLVRYIVVLAVEVILLLIAVVGVGVAEHMDHRFWEGLTIALACGPIVSLSAKGPLLVLRLVWGIRLRRHGERSSGRRAGQFGIGDILVVTALVAFALGLAQWRLGGQDWPAVLIPCLIAGLVGLLVSNAAVLICVLAKDTPVGCAVMLGYAIGIGVTVFVVVSVLVGSPPRGPEPFFFTIGLALSACGTTQLCLWLVKGCGYELARDRTVAVVATLPDVPAADADRPQP